MSRAAPRTRWPILVTLGLLAAMLVGVIVLESTAPALERSAPAVTGLPGPVLDEAVTCTRADDREGLVELQEQFDPEGRITSEAVYACPRLFDGLDVRYVGEVVGDVLRREGGAWVLVNDDAYALEVGPLGAHRELAGFNSGLAVWLPDRLHEHIAETGRFGRRGDVVLIEGVLLRADPADGGGITLRATSLELLAPSVATAEPLNRPLVVAAAVVMLLALGAIVVARRARER